MQHPDFFFPHAVRAMTAQTVVQLRKTTRLISRSWEQTKQTSTNQQPTPNQTKTKTRNPPKKIEIDGGETVKRETYCLAKPLSKPLSCVLLNQIVHPA